MDDLINLIPKSFISLIGIAVILVVLTMMGTIAQEWGKSLYRKSLTGGKEKRRENRSDYEGIERRSDNKELQHSISVVVDALTANTNEVTELITAYKTKHLELTEGIEEIKRKQDKNWKRLFDEELPAIHST